MEASRCIRIEGHVSPGFEAVRDAFAENFSRRHELGGACCVYHRGEKVVDLWGGVRNLATGEPWQEDTMVLVYSTTKGLAAMTLAIAHSRGWLDYEERVCTYWPEFARNGKETITVRQLLAHQAGLFAFDEPVDRSVVADLDRLAVVMARQKPAWEPGTRQGYHGLTLGFYQSELLRRVDPHRRSLGRFFQEEIASPLGLDFYIRLPESIPDSRLARLAKPGRLAMPHGFSFRLMLAAFSRSSNIYRALGLNPGSEVVRDEQRVYARNLEVPSGGGVGTARHRPRLQRVRDRRTGPAIAPANLAAALGAGDSADTRLLRRVPAFRRRAVFAGLHQAQLLLAFRERGVVRIARSRRFCGLRRPQGRRRLRLRHQPDGNSAQRGPAGPGAAQRGVLDHCADA
jgi:CubicO group peptidase (beta-lactamase class C family)